MSADETRLDALAGSVSDDRPVDWDAEESGSGDGAAVRALHDLSRVAEFNRGLQRSGAGAGAAEPGGAEAGRWGELLLLEPVGAGRHGEVWRCWDPTLRREVALKFLQAEPGDAGDRAGRALADEARALARVRHPGVVTVYGIAEHDGRPGLWMELLRGPTLADTIASRGRLGAAEVAATGVALARALESVHAAGIVHRDVKPANVVLEPGGRVVLTDFGLGQRREHQESPLARLSGTPMFMPPERLAGARSSASSDLYALGVTLWYALAGRAPFAATDLESLRAEVPRGPGRPLAAECPEAPRALTATIERAMSPDPARRFANAGELADALAVALNGRAPRAARTRGIGTALAAAAVLAAAVAGLALFSRKPRVVDAPRPASVPAPAAAAASAPYDVEASLVRRSHGRSERLADGDRVAPGDLLSLEFRATRPAWVYVVDEDERGESYLLFPGPAYDRRNPVAPGDVTLLPGTIGGRENGWAVTSRGGREHVLVVASPQPVPELEAELANVPAAAADRPVHRGPAEAVETLRGVGGLAPVPGAGEPRRAGTLARMARLAGRETGVRGTWVRELTLENPAR